MHGRSEGGCGGPCTELGRGGRAGCDPGACWGCMHAFGTCGPVLLLLVRVVLAVRVAAMGLVVSAARNCLCSATTPWPTHRQ